MCVLGGVGRRVEGGRLVVCCLLQRGALGLRLGLWHGAGGWGGCRRRLGCRLIVVAARVSVDVAQTVGKAGARIGRDIQVVEEVFLLVVGHGVRVVQRMQAGARQAGSTFAGGLAGW